MAVSIGLNSMGTSPGHLESLLHIVEHILSIHSHIDMHIIASLESATKILVHSIERVFKWH